MELLLPTCVAAATVSPLCSPVTISYLFFFLKCRFSLVSFKMAIVLFCSCGALHL